MANKSLWQLTWLLLAAWTPPPLHPWRRFLLRLFGARIAPGARVYGSARISDPRNLEMGRHSVIGFHTTILSDGFVVLEDFAILSQYSQIDTTSWDLRGSEPRPRAEGVRMSRFSWAASCSYIGPGVVLGEGAVLGAGAVTFISLDPWTISVGNPAQPKRKRRNWLLDGQGRDRGRDRSS